MNDKPWKSAALPENEDARLDELLSYKILDTAPELAFDRLTHMAARHFHMPMALISLLDNKRQWFKSHYGLAVSETPRNLAFCAHLILQDGVMVVPDAATDPRFAGNPLVTDAPHIRFYAGAPLLTRNDYKLGTLCIIDNIPHPEFTEDQKRELQEIAAIVMDEMDLRLANQRENTQKLQPSTTPPITLSRLQLVAETNAEMAFILDIFFKSAQQAALAMDGARHQADFQRWKKAAHSLRGSAANLGMTTLEKICHQSEQAKELKQHDYENLYNQLVCELERVRAYLAHQHPSLLTAEGVI